MYNYSGLSGLGYETKPFMKLISPVTDPSLYRSMTKHSPEYLHSLKVYETS